MIDPQKCAIIGCGNVGATTAYTLMLSGMMSEIVLIDINREKAYGEALDLNHGMLFAPTSHIHEGSYADAAGCGLIIYAAGANQRLGETRLDLAQKNADILKSVLDELLAYNRECLLLIVTNPVDVLTHIALRHTGFPAGRVIGSGTLLDTSRLRFLLGTRLSISPRSVDAWIIGEHGDSELAVWSAADVAGLPLSQVSGPCCQPLGQDELQPLFEHTRSSADRIIASKGATYYAVALAVCRIVEAILRDEGAILPVSHLMEGQHGIRDVCLGYPAIIGKAGVTCTWQLPLNPQEEQRLRASADTLRGVLNTLQV
nr:L-lactate dehydrogenase [bacterium]